MVEASWLEVSMLVGTDLQVRLGRCQLFSGNAFLVEVRQDSSAISMAFSVVAFRVYVAMVNGAGQPALIEGGSGAVRKAGIDAQRGVQLRVKAASEEGVTTPIATRSGFIRVIPTFQCRSTFAWNPACRFSSRRLPCAGRGSSILTGEGFFAGQGLNRCSSSRDLRAGKHSLPRR